MRDASVRAFSSSRILTLPQQLGQVLCTALGVQLYSRAAASACRRWQAGQERARIVWRCCTAMRTAMRLCRV